MAKESKPRFTLQVQQVTTEDPKYDQGKHNHGRPVITITETATGHVGQVTKNENGYAVHLLSGPAEEGKKKNLVKRMRNWYVYSQLKK